MNAPDPRNASRQGDTHSFIEKSEQNYNTNGWCDEMLKVGNRHETGPARQFGQPYACPAGLTTCR
jgi:hypothetical protein